jgi:hypothetical protein
MALLAGSGIIIVPKKLTRHFFRSPLVAHNPQHQFSSKSG